MTETAIKGKGHNPKDVMRGAAWAWEHPDKWAEDVLGAHLDPIQCDSLIAVRDYARVDLKSGNGVGKTYYAAVCALWFLYCRIPSTVVITSSTDRQLWRQFWPELKRLYYEAKVKLPGRLLEKYLTVDERLKWFIIGFATSEEAKFEGFHNDSVLLIFDEAKGIGEDIWRAGERLLRGKGMHRWLACGTPPLAPVGEFCQISLDPRKAALWKHLQMSAWDSPRVSREACQAALDTYGKDNPFYVSMVLGQIPKQSDDALISIQDVEEAANLDAAAGPLRAVGVDVSRKGEDKTVITLNLWPKFVQFKHPGTDTIPWTTARIKEALSPYPNAREVPLHIDDSGVGGGVTDELEAEGYNAIPCNFGGKANDEEHYYDFGTEMYATLGKLFKDRQISIPNDPLLKAQLYQRTMVEPRRKGGKWLLKLLSKPEMRKHKMFKGFKSPDEADSLALAACEPPPESREDLSKYIPGVSFAGEIARR